MRKQTSAALAAISFLFIIGAVAAPAASADELDSDVEASDSSTSVPALTDDSGQVAAVDVAAVSVTGEPVLTITPANCVPQPGEGIKIVTWDIPDGLSIGGVTGTGQAAEDDADVLSAATSGGGGMMKPRYWVLPVTVLDGYTYDGPTSVTLTQTTDAPGGNLANCPAPATAAPTAPSAPASPASAPDPVDEAAAPVAATTPAATATPVAADPSVQVPTTELAYTGIDGRTATASLAAAVLMLTLGGTLLHAQRMKSRRP